jgi:hypothetical protein
MNLKERVSAFTQLGRVLSEKLNTGALDALISKAYFENQWFTEENTKKAIHAIINNFLDPGKIEVWLGGYDEDKLNKSPQTVGLVMAGNLPLVGWQDLMCVLISGNRALVKLSSKDHTLPKMMINELIEVEPRIKDSIQMVEQLKDFDAVIATGSNNTMRYFEYYFGKYPHILRKNRNSVAVLTGKESNSDLEALSNDIMEYFGLGCRNVSFLLVPQGYDFREFFEAAEQWNIVLQHNKYANNYTYNKSLLLLNKEKHLDNGFLLLKESDTLATPVSVINFRYCKDMQEAKEFLEKESENIQCVASLPGVIENSMNFGKTQQPGLSDYADGVDVMEFLLGL